MYFFFADHANEHIDQLQAITIQWTELLYSRKLPLSEEWTEQ